MLSMVSFEQPTKAFSGICAMVLLRISSLNRQLMFANVPGGRSLSWLEFSRRSSSLGMVVWKGCFGRDRRWFCSRNSSRSCVRLWKVFPRMCSILFLARLRLRRLWMLANTPPGGVARRLFERSTYWIRGLRLKRPLGRVLMLLFLSWRNDRRGKRSNALSGITEMFMSQRVSVRTRFLTLDRSRTPSSVTDALPSPGSSSLSGS
mmetsp:Transcript_25589/g.49819  ORF Transcript_25589/g.49819 Transcript_25589/m.49819 type:complete len:205 (-) Transcript_25589:346-960(-)